MKEPGNPVVLTVNGKAEVVVQDAAAYQRLLALAEKAGMMEFLREAKADADAGRTAPACVFLQGLGQKKKAKKA
jgi:PHD/YefM family antitoxin component YafN of YafNO toxin-antitoxin module